MSKLTHLDASGAARMVDVGKKTETVREARAEAHVFMSADTLHLIESGGHSKGDVIAVARIAGIQAALDIAMQGKTVIAIAHRLSTIARMDRIVVLDEGRIVEEGTHTDLLAENGLYARYWHRQSGGFIGITEAAE